MTRDAIRLPGLIRHGSHFQAGALFRPDRRTPSTTGKKTAPVQTKEMLAMAGTRRQNTRCCNDTSIFDVHF
jgi:hypothetical protein